jgi:galactan endo-1,6-beta-galactosidase
MRWRWGDSFSGTEGRKQIMPRLGLAALTLIACMQISFAGQDLKGGPDTHASAAYITLDPAHDLGTWQGWGSSLSWWGRAIGGTQNGDFYADLIYTTKEIDGLSGLGLNIVRYNVGGGGINQPQENKGPRLQWQMDIHGFWTNPSDSDPSSWNWSVDQNQRTMMQKARDRGANAFEMFSDSPMWWMNSNHSTAGSDTGGDCLPPENYDRFAFYLAAVARYSADHWGIKFDSVEPFNEPSANWWKHPGRQEGCHFDFATQQKVIQRLRHALDQAHLIDVAVAAADENNVDAALSTWRTYDSATRALVGRVNVHGYANGTEPYRGANRAELRREVGSKRLWQSEYGDGDASGYTMALAIIHDLKELRPTAWVYWQPVEPDVPEFGWGLLNANYVDTQDQPRANPTPLVRVNRKFFVYGQFTRYLPPGYHLIGIADPNSVAAYDRASHRLVIVKVTADAGQTAILDLSGFYATARTIQVIATTTAPGDSVPDWKQHKEILTIEKREGQKSAEAHLYPKSVYTFIAEAVLR